MPLGIVIPALPDEEMSLREFSGLADYQAAVGGLIEPINLTTPSLATMYIDEEAMLKDRHFNARASLIASVHNPAYLFHSAIVLGDVVIVGAPDDEGVTKDVPTTFVNLLLNTKEYKILVQTSDDQNAWNGNARRFTELVDAYDHAVSLAHRWMLVERVRVVPA